MDTQITAFAQARPLTNLLPDATYTLPASKTRTGFLGFFGKKYTGEARRVMMRIALSPLFDTRLLPTVRPRASSEEGGVDIKGIREWEKTRADLPKVTSVRKVNGSDPHFELDLPVVTLSKYNLHVVFGLFSKAPVPPEALEEVARMADGQGTELFPPNIVFGNAGLNNDVESLLRTCLIGVVYKFAHGLCYASLRLRISKEECEHLVSEDWISIRPVDVYPLFSAWVGAEFVARNYGNSAISISKIATTLPPHLEGDERVDQYGVGINLAGTPLYIPAKLDNTEKYESLFTVAGSNPDGSFSLFSLDPEQAASKAKLPVNVPVLTDWVNFKFSYTNSSGRIEVMPLEHIRKCTASMAVNMINSGKVDLARIADWAERYCPRVGLSTALNAYLSDSDLTALQDAQDIYSWVAPMMRNATQRGLTVAQFLRQIEGEFTRGARKKSEYPIGSEFTSDSSSPAFKFVGRLFAQMAPAIVSNLDALYVSYAVSTVTEDLGWIAIFAHYGQDMAITRATAEAATSAAKNQGVDPNWTPPDLPLITKKFGEDDAGFIPHQAKSRNILKDSPDNAVISVDAGGGKSLLSITDILYEIKAKRNAPYLIGCPSHLVANYVSEIVEFTDGMVNVIPITSYNIRTTGYERFTQILSSAPINTIIVFDYDALKFRARSAVYGTAQVEIFPVIELIRRFKPGYVMMDESHLLKNAGSTRYRALMSLVADIPKKRIASGTLNPDSPSDLPGQIAILDPSVLGSREDFNNRFGLDYSGGRVRDWKPDAGAAALSLIKNSCVWVEAKRKEWACALPPRRDRFLAVDLTDAQREIYNALFDDMVQSIRKKAETNKNAKRLLDGLTGKKASKEDEDAFGDLNDDGALTDSTEDILDDEGDIGAGLQPYLAAIEQFVSNPAGHPYAQNGFVSGDTGTVPGKRHPPLSGDDLKSPKALALNQVLNDWFKSNKAKAIVFVNYQSTADALFAAMDPELQAKGFVYRASQKVELVNRFRKDPSVAWMIGIRKSMEVGLNLQVAGLLVRMEGVWTPGEQEQGDSRIARPYFGKGGDQRPMLQFDTIVANHTIDVTKAARLRAKIVALAKFENAHDPRYQGIPSIPVFPMTLDYIQNNNDFGSNLAKYEESMSMLSSVIKEDYAEYRDRIMSEGGFKFTPVKRAPTPPEAAMLSRVPYAQGTELYAPADLGLVRLDNFLGTEMDTTDDEEDESEQDDVQEDEETGNDPRREAIRAQLQLIMGLRCHTEYGEGEIVGGAAGSSAFITRVRVRFDDGTTARNLRSTNVFVVTRTETNSKDLRHLLAKAAGLPVVGDITVPGNNLRVTKVTKKMEREEQQKREEAEEAQRKARKSGTTGVALQLSIINGYMRLSYAGDDGPTKKALQAIGFKLDQPYVATRIRDHKHLIAQATEWQRGGFDTSRDVDNDSLSWLAHELASGGLRTHKHYANAVQRGFQNYLRRVWKPSADKTLLNIFALITDGGADDPAVQRRAAKDGVDPSYGIAYLCLPYGAGFPATKEAIKEAYRRPATRWVIHQGTMSMFVGSLDAVRSVFATMRDAGITLNNKDELERQAKSVRRVPAKKDSTLDSTI